MNNETTKYRIATGVIVILFSLGIAMNLKYVKDVLGIVLSNTTFWYFIVIAIGSSFINFYIYKKEVLLKEMLLQILGLFVITMGIFYLFFDMSNLKDIAIFNSKIKEAVYEEPYTENYTVEVCSGSGEHRTCHTETRTRRIPSKYYLLTTDNDTVNISPKTYKNYVSKYNNAYEVKTHRSSQTMLSKARGEGDIWHVKPTSTLPSSIEKNVVNYIKLSKKTLYKKGLKTDLNATNEIQEYPKTFNSGYGKIEFNRIIKDKNVNVTQLDKLNKQLNIFLAEYGKIQEVNVILYLTKNKNRSFPQFVERKWKSWKKNDVVIFIDMNKANKINWVQIRAFTKHALFKVELRDNILNSKNWNTTSIFKAIETQLKIDKNKPNGFLRTSMEEYRYLINEIEISNWWWLILILSSFALNFGISYYVRNNSYKQ